MRTTSSKRHADTLLQPTTTAEIRTSVSMSMGNIYLPKALPLTELPDERMQFTLGLYGEGDFFTMKGVIEEFLEQASV